MKSCPRCQRDLSRSGSRVHLNILRNCPKNKQGACFPCQKLSEIERKVADARRTLDLLLDERTELASALNEHHDPLIRRLPVEIVSRIFVDCKPDASNSDGTSDETYDEEELVRAVLTPGQICRKWRQIAQRTPNLWDVLCASFTASNCVFSVEIVERWLERSGGLPLFLQLRIEVGIYESSDVFRHFARKVFSMITHHAKRWKTLDLQVPDNLLPHISQQIATTNMDALDFLKYAVSCELDRDLFLHASPRLLVHRGSWLRTINMNWQHLTVFISHNVCPEELVQLFKDAPRLSFCKLTEADPDEYTPAPSPVVHSSLRTFISRRVPDKFWDNFTFPSLETLHITEPHPDSEIENFLRRFDCKVKNLHIKYEDGDLDHVIRLLKLTPNLEHLTLADNIAQGPFFLKDGQRRDVEELYTIRAPLFEQAQIVNMHDRS